MGRKKLKQQQGGWSREDPEFLEAKSKLIPSPEAILGKQIHETLTTLGIPVPPADPPEYTKMLTYTSPYITVPGTPTSAQVRDLILDRVPRFDNEDYSVAKFTVIQPGTLVYRRQKTNDFSSELTTRYFNYSGRTDPGQAEGGRISFLKEPQPPLTQEYYNGAVREFGTYFFTIRVKEPLLILHIPDSIPSSFEGRIRHFFGSPWAAYLPFIDGYTFDYLQWNPNEIYKDLPSLRGFRELVVKKAANKMEVVSVIQDPAPIVAPIASPVAAPVAALPPPRRVFITAEATEANNSHGVFISKNQYPMYIRNSTIAKLRNGRIVRGELTPDDGYEIEGTGELVPETNIVKLWAPMEGGRRRKITRKRKSFSRKQKKSVRGRTRAKKLS